MEKAKVEDIALEIGGIEALLGGLMLQYERGSDKLTEQTMESALFAAKAYLARIRADLEEYALG